MGLINAAINMKEYFAAENLWGEIASAHKLNGGGLIVREGIGGGECSRLSGRAGELGLYLPRGGDGWVGRVGWGGNN